MSNHVSSQVYKRKLGSATRKAVMVLLADKASDDGGGIWASKQRMADELDMSKQTVINTIKAFISEGLLEEVGRRKCPNGFTILYAINLDAIAELPFNKSHDDQSTSLTGQRALPVNVDDLTGQRALPDQSTSLTQTPLNHPEPPKDIITPEMVFESWNELATECGLPKAKNLTDTRRKQIKARLKQYPDVEDWKAALKCIYDTPWLRGDNDRGWKADLNFLLQEKSFTRLTEGSYGRD